MLCKYVMKHQQEFLIKHRNLNYIIFSSCNYSNAILFLDLFYDASIRGHDADIDL